MYMYIHNCTDNQSDDSELYPIQLTYKYANLLKGYEIHDQDRSKQTNNRDMDTLDSLFKDLREALRNEPCRNVGLEI